MGVIKPSSFYAPVRTLLCAAMLCVSVAACNKGEPHADVVADYAQKRTLASERVEGAWVVDGKTYFERELGESTPELVDELLRRRKVGYLIDGNTIEYWVTTPDDQYTMRTNYVVVEQDESQVDLRVLDDGQDDSAQRIAGDTDALRFVFVDEDHVELYAIFEDETDDGEPPHSIPLVRLNRDDFDAHFRPENRADASGTPALQHEEAPDVGEKLHGMWVLDHAATVASLPEAERPLDGFSVRFAPLIFVFDEDANLRIEELSHHTTGTLDAKYRVVRDDDDRLIIESWAEDTEEGVNTGSLVGRLLLNVLGDDQISVVRFRPSVPTQKEARRHLVRVDQAGLDAYRENPPNRIKVSKAQAQRLAKRLDGAWLVDTQRSLAQLPEDAHDAHRKLLVERAVGLRFSEDGAVQVRVFYGETPMVTDAEYVVIDARKNAMILGMQYEGNPALLESMFILQGDDHLVFKPTSGQEGSQAVADRQAIVLERVSREAFEAHFEEPSKNVEESAE